MRQYFLLAAGFGALLLGGLGLLLPVLPTTPFVLCAAACFATASPRMYQRLLNMRYFGEYVQNYRHKAGISTKARVLGLVSLWLALGLSALLTRSLAMAAVLAVVGLAVSVHLLCIRKKAQ